MKRPRSDQQEPRSVSGGSTPDAKDRPPRASQRGGPDRPSVHLIHVTHPPRGCLLVIVGVLGIATSFLIGFCVAFMAAGWALHYVGTWLHLQQRGSGQTLWVVAILLSMVGGLAAIACWAWALSALELRRARRLNGDRVRRLDRVAAHSDARARVPGRCVEHALWCRSGSGRSLRRALEAIGPGRVIVNPGPRGHGRLTPARTPLRFEPIDLDSNDDRWTWLAQQAAPDPTSDTIALAAQAAVSGHRREAGRITVNQRLLNLFGRGLMIVLMLFGGAFLLRDLYWLVTTGTIESGAVIAMGAAALLAGLALLRLLTGRSWWLVPGGAICRRYHAWRTHVSVSLITPADASLYVTADGSAYLLHRRHLHYLHVPNPWAFVAAWISTTPPPTRDAVLSFVGPDAVWESNE